MHRRLLPLYFLISLSAAGYGAIFTLAAAFRDRFGFSDTGVGVIVAVGFLAGFVSQVGLSRLADRGHAAVMIRSGVAVLVASMVLMAVGTELWHFVAGRALLGLGGGMTVPGARRVVITLDPDNMGHNLGMLGSFHLTGFIVGPAIAAALNELGGVRAPFVAMAVLAAFAALFTGRIPADTGERTEERHVLRGLLRRPGIQAALLMTVAFYVMVGTWEALWAIMLTDLGAGTWVIALTLSVTSVPMILLGPRAGRLAQARGPLRVAAIGLGVTIPCMAGYGALTSVVALVALAVIQSLGDSFSYPATRVAAAAASPADLHASTQGLLGATEVLVAGLVALPAAWAYGHHGAGWTWFFAAVLTLGAVAASLIVARAGGPSANAADTAVLASPS